MFYLDITLSKEDNFFLFLELIYKKIDSSQPIWPEISNIKNYNKIVFKNTGLKVEESILENYYFEIKKTLRSLPDGIDYTHFVNLICRNPNKTFYKEKYYPFYDYHNVNFREKISFNKNKSVIKEKKDNPNKEWRLFKKVKKDKSKKHYRRGLNSEWKRNTHQAHRSHIKQLIKNEKFDEVSKEIQKWFLDPWDWD